MVNQTVINYVIHTPAPLELWFWTFLLPIFALVLMVSLLYYFIRNRKNYKKSMTAIFFGLILTFLYYPLRLTAFGIWFSYAVLATEMGIDYFGDLVTTTGYANMVWDAYHYGSLGIILLIIFGWLYIYFTTMRKTIRGMRR